VKKAAGKIPPKVWLFLAIAIALGLAVWFIDRRGYQRAKEQERAHTLERAGDHPRRRRGDRRSSSTIARQDLGRRRRPDPNHRHGRKDRCSTDHHARDPSRSQLSLILAAASLPACSPRLTPLEAISSTKGSPAVPKPPPILDPPDPARVPAAGASLTVAGGDRLGRRRSSRSNTASCSAQA
jgi:hypothetical protein